MKSLAETIFVTRDQGIALGHFNISDEMTLRAIFESARELNLPVLIGTSEGEADFLSRMQAAALVRSLREEYDFPIYLNADHHHSLDSVKKAVAAGYDAILFDGGKLPLAENIAQTKAVVEYAKSVNPNILVEGELGYIGSGSEIISGIPEGAAVKPEDLTKPEEAARFVKETGVDLLAPAVGNIHGMIEGATTPGLDIERIKAVKAAAGVPLVLHGGSGTAEVDLAAAVQAGVAIIHIATEIRVAWRKGVEEGLKNVNEVAPYKILTPALLPIKQIVSARLKLFSRKQSQANAR